MTPRNENGQTLIEFAMATLLATLTCIGVACLMKESWEKTRCAYLTFEKTHAFLVGQAFSRFSSSGVSLEQDDSMVHGKGRCGRATEEVRLWKL